MQPNKENVVICVNFAPLKKLSNSGGYFSGYTIFCHEKYRNKHFRDGVNKTDENQDFQKGFFVIEGPVCSRRRPLQNLMG